VKTEDSAKQAEMAILQASFDSLTQSSTSSEASLKALHSAHTAQGHQLTQNLSKVQDLTGQLAEQEAAERREAVLKDEAEKERKHVLMLKGVLSNSKQSWTERGVANSG
jgi:nucleoprotein TPR